MSKSFKTTLLATSILAIGLTAGVAVAQEQPPAQQEQVTIDEVVVTGTRLRLPAFQGSNPVSSVTGESLALAGITNVTDFLTDMPALVGSTTLQDNSNAGNRGSVGLNLLDLRNLGNQRTLVLVNGRRHVASQGGSTAVDVNSIPVALIDRVDVLTGGASAIYGADGVSGVVNFVLKTDFEGVKGRAQYGFSEQGGGENGFIDILAGHNFADGKANLTLGVEYSDTKAIAREDRDFASLAERESVVVNPDYDGQPGQYRRIFARSARYIDSSPGGSVYTDLNFGAAPGSTSGVDFNGNGTPFRDGVYTSGATMIGGDGTQLAAFTTDLTPGLTRAALNSTFNIEFLPSQYFFGELKYVNTRTQFKSQPTFDYALFLSMDNPYMPAAIRAAALDDGLGTQEGVDAFEEMTGEVLPGPGVLMARDNFDLGEVYRDVERETYRGVVGFRGDLGDSLSYEASLNYGRTVENNIERNNRINERWFAAMDAVRDPLNGNIVCRSTLDPSAAPYGNAHAFVQSPFNQSTFGTTFTPGRNSGCIPINVFGEGNISDEAKAWILTDSTSRDRVEQFVFNAFVSGDSTPMFQLPAGPIAFSAGVEYRHEKALYIPSEEEMLGASTGEDVTWLGQGSPLSGQFDVSEIFGELSAPLLADLPFAKRLTLDAAYRYSDYSTVGQTDAYKVGLLWAVNDTVFLRGTKAKAVRAPSISELFSPLNQTFAILSDPCDRNSYQNGVNPAVREANCRAMLGLAAGAPYTFTNTSSSSIEGVVGGNVDLKPEDADTLTFGVVLTPTFIPGLSIAIDYYDIELTNAIQFFTAQNIVNKCYDLPQPNQFCDLISRNPSNNLINGFEQFGVNVAEYTTSGYDFTIDYLLDPARFGIERDIGTFRFTLAGNHLENLTFTEDPANPLSSTETAGTRQVPEWQATLDIKWEWRDVLVNYGYNWFDETVRYQNVQADYIEPEYLNYSARSTHDIQVRYNVRENLSLYGGVNNFTDQQPDRGLVDYPVGPLGRYFYMGINMSL